ncbi:hypothetical protein [Falsiroseomonas sp. CW058]|uniref:hypothetical protein n=1 Tax=Falsiroseomonas sp. CW058 TaxID=3388664 RepID=UPI003D314317
MNAREIPKPGRGAGYRKASEVGTFLFCRRAWWFERQGAPSDREPERVLGTAYHQRHGERVAATPRVQVLARLVLALAVTLFLLGLWLSVP